MKKTIVFLLAVLLFSSCSENYSNGERIGLITQFSKSGIIWKTHEGHLNMTQTGMNSSTPFDFSIDRDNEPAGLVATIDSAAQLGWKVKLTYHETMGWNWLNNRGETNHFIITCEVLDKTPIHSALGGDISNGTSQGYIDGGGKVVDTVYMMVLPADFDYQEYLKTKKN